MAKKVISKGSNTRKKCIPVVTWVDNDGAKTCKCVENAKKERWVNMEDKVNNEIDLGDFVDVNKSEDLWAGTSNMRCDTCFYYVEKREGLGRCRRHAPVMNGFPTRFPGDWCGDHKLD